MECFCFDNQTLQAGEEKEMPLRFVVSPGLPEDIKTLTLSYTFMNTNRDAIRQGGEPLQLFPATGAVDSPGEMNSLALTMKTSTGGHQR